jgi:hypothetical protein
MYHVERNKGRCDFTRRKTTGIVEREGQNQPEIELIDASEPSHTRGNNEKNVVAPPRDELLDVF